jgi:hypothetical protein
MSGKRYRTTSNKLLKLVVPGHDAVAFDRHGDFPPKSAPPCDMPAVQNAIENHEWFGHLVFIAGEDVQVDTGDPSVDEMIRRAHNIAVQNDPSLLNPERRRPKKPEAIRGMINSESGQEPEPEPLPTAGEINFMKKSALVELVSKHGIDADPELPYNALKKQVRDWRVSQE